MKKIKALYRLICFCVLIGVILCFGKSSITMETKSTNTNINKNINLNAMAKVINNFAKEDVTISLDTYYGTLTAYVANCPECSGKLGCNGQNVLDGTTTYSDATYGTVRIVASSTNLACGSIVRFLNPANNSETITAIVLDRGVTGTTLDLLVDSVNTAITQVGTRKINYDILRFGWTREQL